MKKRKLIINTLVSILFISGLILHFYWFVIPNKKIAKECQGFVPNWVDFIDCHGVVSVNDGWDMDYLSIKDHVHDYEIARVYNQSQYVFVQDKLFVINRKNIENSSSNGYTTTYYQELFQINKLAETEYESISDIPNYLVIDTISGEVKAYKNISDAPIDQQDIFKELENK